MRLRTTLEWTAFVLISIALWLAAGLFLFIVGGVSCKITETCLRDRFVAFAILLLLPAQAATATWLRSRQRNRSFD